MPSESETGKTTSGEISTAGRLKRIGELCRSYRTELATGGRLWSPRVQNDPRQIEIARYRVQEGRHYTNLGRRATYAAKILINEDRPVRPYLDLSCLTRDEMADRLAAQKRASKVRRQGALTDDQRKEQRAKDAARKATQRAKSKM